ncbi:MAG: bifunctional metallophosphatase/5'-nucleotidase, partial [Mailhella sp.]
CERFERFIKSLNVPVLAANLSQGKNAFPSTAPWIVTEKKGRRIGLIGLVNPETPELSSPCAEAKFGNAEKALRKAVDELTAQNVNIIILITHLGLADDRALARSVSGIDIVVGGHTHSILSNTDKNAVGPYPIVETSPANEPVLVVTNGYALKTLGHINVSFDAKGIIKKWSGAPVPLNDATLNDMGAPAADSSLAAMMEVRSAPVRQMLEEPVGNILSDIGIGLPLEKTSVLQCRSEECLSGNIVTDAMREFWKGKADIALMGGGTVRNSLPSGKVTAGDIIASLPFENTLMLTEMDGKTLLAALEHGLSRYEEGKGYFLQVSGLRYTFDASQEKGKRLLSAQVPGKNGVWKKVDPHAIYRVSTSNFQARGGDGYSMFANLTWKDSEQNLSDIVREYIRSHTPVSIKLEGRISKK